MIRPIILIFFTTITSYAQDSTLVKDFCNLLGKFSANANIESEVAEVVRMTQTYMERDSATTFGTLQDRIRFQYRITVELMKSCPNYQSDRAWMVRKNVIDLENILTEQQIDTLSKRASQIKKDIDIYLYIVTVDDFYPDSTITDFSNRYRDHWAPRMVCEKGVVLIVFSKTQREIMISTGNISMTYLTDDECRAVNKAMTPYFRNGQYFQGLLKGLLAIPSKL
jgi:hypothetical protein